MMLYQNQFPVFLERIVDILSPKSPKVDFSKVFQWCCVGDRKRGKGLLYHLEDQTDPGNSTFVDVFFAGKNTKIPLQPYSLRENYGKTSSGYLRHFPKRHIGRGQQRCGASSGGTATEKKTICRLIQFLRHPIIFSDNDWDVQSPPKRIIIFLVPLPFSRGDWIPRDFTEPLFW